MTVPQLREFFSRSTPHVAGLAALAAALDAKATGTPLPAAIDEEVRGVLGALGAADILEGVSADEATGMLGMIRFTVILDTKLMFADKRAMVWNHAEPELLQAGGDVSVGHAQGLSRMIAPALEGLTARLAAPGAAFLDVGTGVGGLAIAMARIWPELRTVGIDPWQPALKLARENVRQAGLESRIELREQAAEDLPDESAFDVVWFPIPFMQERTIPAGARRVLRALRPGGWAVFNLPNRTGDPVVDAVWRLRTTCWGGHTLEPSEIERIMRESGFEEVRTLPSPPGMPVAFTVGRRKPA